MEPGFSTAPMSVNREFSTHFTPQDRIIADSLSPKSRDPPDFPALTHDIDHS